MTILKKLSRVLLYLSFGFIVYYLYSYDYIVLSEISYQPYYLIASLIALWAGFFVSTLSWKASLQSHGIKINTALAVYSHGISVFAKYIPGKIWVILGRASIVSEKSNSLSVLSTISLKEQLVYLFLGLCISLTVLPFMPIDALITLFVALSALGLGIFLFVKPIHEFFIRLFFKMLKKQIDIPFISIKEVWSFAWVILLYWFLWSVGFFILVKSIIPETSIITAFAFPVSVCYGLLAVIVPGGIGVRESIIVLFLTASGIAPSISITLSLIQRLWFITGEIFIFALALFEKKQIKKSET